MASHLVCHARSLPGGKPRKVAQMQAVWAWLVHECHDKGALHLLHAGAAPRNGRVAGGAWRLAIAADVPCQRDNTSCGVFMLAAMDLVARGLHPPYAYAQPDSALMRRGVAAEILAGRVRAPCKRVD